MKQGDAAQFYRVVIQTVNELKIVSSFDCDTFKDSVKVIGIKNTWKKVEKSITIRQWHNT